MALYFDCRMLSDTRDAGARGEFAVGWLRLVSGVYFFLPLKELGRSGGKFLRRGVKCAQGEEEGAIGEHESSGGEREGERVHAMGVYVTRALVAVTSRRRDAVQRLHTVDSAVNYCIIRSRPYGSMNYICGRDYRPLDRLHREDYPRPRNKLASEHFRAPSILNRS